VTVVDDGDDDDDDDEEEEEEYQNTSVGHMKYPSDTTIINTSI
jgi:hypothetical protein